MSTTSKKPFAPPTTHTRSGLKVESSMAGRKSRRRPPVLTEEKKKPEKAPSWWEGMSPPGAEVGEHGSPSVRWAYARMLYSALQGKKTLYKGSTSGHVGKKGKEIAESITRLQPGFPIEMKVQSKGDSSPTTTFVWDEGYLELSHWAMDDEVNVTVCCSDKALIQKILRQVTNHVIPRKSLGRVYVIGSGMGGPQFFNLGVASVKMERSNYAPSTLKAYDHVVEDLSSISPCGRLAIFDGPPGTGKTFLIRAILDAVEDAMFVLVPPEMMGMLASPELIPMLLRKKAGGGGGGPIIFILEDADNLLTPRDSKNLSLISSLLNFSSGMLGSMLDIRAIATTNSEKKDIDAALMRPGRLCRQVTVGALSSKQALTVMKRLVRMDNVVLPKELENSNQITLAQAYRAARDAGWKPTGEADAEDKRKYGDHAADTETPLSVGEGTVMVNSREFGEDFVIHRVNSEVDLLS